MTSQNVFMTAAGFVGRELIGGMLYYPIWWYGAGLLAFLKRRGQSLQNFEASVGLTVWIINWTTPMFGQYDIWGKIISFGVRTAVIIFKSAQVVLYCLGQLVMILGWLGLPMIVVWELWYHLSAWL
ncbi:MAG: hypothetical protein AAB817_01205 [Patescibacteria group bacterium]